MKKRIISIVLTFCMVFMLVPITANAMQIFRDRSVTGADSLTLEVETGWVLDNGNWYYLNEDGVMQTGWVQDGSDWYYLGEDGALQTRTSAKKVTGEDTTWSGTKESPGWYMVDSDVTINSRVTVSGDVHLLLTDDCSLTVNGGVQVEGSDALTIYGQSTDEETMGKLTAQNVRMFQAGIGGGEYGDGGTFQTNDGDAVIFASSIADQTNQDNWSGVICQDSNNSIIYKTSVVLPTDFIIESEKEMTIGADQTLTIPEGVTLTVNGTLINNGTIVIQENGKLNNSGSISSSGKIYVDGTFAGTADNLYYPLSLVNAITDENTSVYNTKTYGKAGSEITLIPEAPTGQECMQWDVSIADIVVNKNRFTMPHAALKVTAQLTVHTDAEPKDHICDTCGVTLSEHEGGEATCMGKAVCDYCGEEYGEYDSLNHNLEKISEKDATVTETGNKEYWHCLECGKYFADENGTNEIKLDETVTAKLPPKIIEGAKQSLTTGDQKELTFRSNAAFREFIRVELDGKILDAANYTAEEGSTIVTLKAGYVGTLSAGKHTIGIVDYTSFSHR